MVISLGKVWIQLVSLQPWVNSRADWALWLRYGNQYIKKTLNSNQLWLGEGWAPPGHSCPRHATWVAPQQPKQVLEPVSENWVQFYWNQWLSYSKMYDWSKRSSKEQWTNDFHHCWLSIFLFISSSLEGIFQI